MKKHRGECVPNKSIKCKIPTPKTLEEEFCKESNRKLTNGCEIMTLLDYVA